MSVMGTNASRAAVAGDQPPAVSFIIPAYNEEVLVGGTIAALYDAMDGLPLRYEIIVVNDASTDRTAEVGRSSGGRVIDVHKRQIAAVRNAGAREARGELFIFVDADTMAPESTIRAALAEMSAGAVGGGASARCSRNGIGACGSCSAKR